MNLREKLQSLAAPAASSAAGGAAPRNRRVLIAAAAAVAVAALAVGLILLMVRDTVRGGTRFRFTVKPSGQSLTVTVKGDFAPDQWRVADDGATVQCLRDEAGKAVFRLDAPVGGSYQADFGYYDESYTMRMDYWVEHGKAEGITLTERDYRMETMEGECEDFSYTISRSTAGVRVQLEKLSHPEIGYDFSDTFVAETTEEYALRIQKKISQATSDVEIFYLNAQNPTEETVTFTRPGQKTRLALAVKTEENGVLTVESAAFEEDLESAKAVKPQPTAEPAEDRVTGEGGSENAEEKAAEESAAE